MEIWLYREDEDTRNLQEQVCKIVFITNISLKDKLIR